MQIKQQQQQQLLKLYWCVSLTSYTSGFILYLDLNNYDHINTYMCVLRIYFYAFDMDKSIFRGLGENRH